MNSMPFVHALFYSNLSCGSLKWHRMEWCYIFRCYIWCFMVLCVLFVLFLHGFRNEDDVDTLNSHQHLKEFPLFFAG